ncbi:MAG: hypothetical protein R2761_03205 [Acidimicrobiales bacterium]
MIDEPTTEERLAALLARRSGKAARSSAGRKPEGAVTPMRQRRATPDEMPPRPVGRGGPQPTASTPFERSFDRWPGSWDDAPQPPAPAGTPAGGPAGSVFDFDTPGWPAPDADHLAGPNRTGPARRLLADNTMPLAAVPPASMPEDATLGGRVRDGAERWVRSWSPSRLVASGASAVSFAAMVVAMGPLLQPNEETATDAGTGTGTGTGEIDPALTSGVESPAVSISVDPLAGVPGTPLDATGQPVPLSGTAPDGTLPGTASSTVGTVAGASTAAPTASGVSTTQPAAGSPATSAAAGTTPATAAPTTQPPATAAPTTAKPGSTAAPTTQPPATAAPTTQPPATAAPTTQAPTTAAPTTAKPTTTAPPTTKAS